MAKAKAAAPAPKQERKEIDWEAIQVAYLAGIASVRAIAKDHGVSHPAILKRAEAEGWERDLTAKVKARTAAKLIRETGYQDEGNRTGYHGKTDTDLVENASEVQLAVIRMHQRRTAEAQSLADGMLAELRTIYATREELELAIEEDTAAGEGDTAAEAKAKRVRRDRLFHAIGLPSRAATLLNLTSSIQKLIPLERQARSIDDGQGNSPPPEATVNHVRDNLSRKLGRIASTTEAGSVAE
jgi:hypothetical protein